MKPRSEIMKKILEKADVEEQSKDKGPSTTNVLEELESMPAFIRMRLSIEDKIELLNK
jgi:hypothetical protein